jgi:hypothetical protein
MFTPDLLYVILSYIFLCIFLVVLKHIIYGPDDYENNQQNEQKKQ